VPATGPSKRRALLAHGVSVMLLLAAGASHAASDWQQLGPPGGPVGGVAVGPSSVYVTASAERGRLYRSDDGGSHWIEHALPCDGPLQARADGRVFVHCTGAIYGSVDRGATWSLYGPYNHDGDLLFDPFVPSRAVVVGGSQQSIYVDATQDDGVTWTYQYPDYGAYNPGDVVYDPRRAGRLVGVGNNFNTIPITPNASLQAFESFDQGRHWQVIATLATPGTFDPTCYPGPLRADVAGRFYVAARCGFFRSIDGGAHWQRLLTFAEALSFELAVDPIGDGHVVMLSGVGPSVALTESRDAGVTWSPLPMPPGGLHAFAFAPNGDLWAATGAGVARYDPGANAWTPRSDGINTHPLGVLEPAAGPAGAVVLNALETLNGPRAGDAQSADGGATWHWLDIAGEDVVELARNPSVPSSLMAVTAPQHLHASVDGGITWTLVATSPALPSGEILQAIVPAGPQPGLVYGLHATCVSNGFACGYRAQGVSRSTDGGRTWTHATAGITGEPTAVVPSAADPLVAMTVVAFGGAYVTEDGGLHWRTTAPVAAVRVSADPSSIYRWYASGYGSVAHRTDDLGATWVPLGDTLLASADYDLLPDPHVPGRVLAVGTAADVSISDDRGASWRRIVQPSPTLRLASHSVRVGPESPTTLYAASSHGAVKLVLSGPPDSAKLRVIEFHNDRLDHYFMTGDPAEIALIDADYFRGWSRTGAAFDALPPATTPGGGASPVCRFYGRPEKGLDTHFYSASPVECQQVRDRFGDAWIFESAAVFSVYLPTIEGACPAGTLPLYRVYNDRADANHRYTTSAATRDAMVASGWIAEGYGIAAVAMCVP
jgi:photosystem II stability/assembly factor-like uncharacterized protein